MAPRSLVMSDRAIIGSAPPEAEACNIADYLFSNPFQDGSESLKTANSLEAQRHSIPSIPLHQPLLVNPITGAQVSWGRTREDALRIAAGLHALGLRPAQSDVSSKEAIISPVVLIHLPNSLAFAPILFGVFASGLTATMANPGLTSKELAWVLTHSEPEVVITTPEGYSNIKKAISQCESRSVKNALINKDRIFIVDSAHDDYGLTDIAVAAAKGRALAGTRDWKTLLARQPLQSAFAITQHDYHRRAAVILWSSGTSGRSKGVVLSHASLVHNVLTLWHINLSYTSDERWLGFAPFYHTFGLSNILLISAACGATVFVMPKFDPVAMLSHIQTHKITFLHMAPPVAVILAKSPMIDGYDLRSIRGGVSGGAPLPTEIIEQVHSRLSILIKMGYGLSETGSVSNQTGATWSALKPQLGNSGSACYGVEIKITSPDDPEQTLQRGEEGEILVRSPMLLTSYLHNPTATAEALTSDNWFRTGDVGKIDAANNLWITDRLKEVIKVKGFQVPPSELENILCGCPRVADAAVTGVYDREAATEMPRAYVVPADKAVWEHCKEGKVERTRDLMELAEEVRVLVEGKTIRYKWLTGGVVFIQQVPKSPSGKILRRLLKDVQGVEIPLYAAKDRQKAKL